MTLLQHTSSQMQVNKIRGSTEVYTHCVRMGSQAWYHSNVIERFDDPSGGIGAIGWSRVTLWIDVYYNNLNTLKNKWYLIQRV